MLLHLQQCRWNQRLERLKIESDYTYALPAIRSYSLARLVICCTFHMFEGNYFASSPAFLWSMLSSFSFNLRSASAAGWYSLTQLSVLPVGNHAVNLWPLITGMHTGMFLWLHICSSVAMV